MTTAQASQSSTPELLYQLQGPTVVRSMGTGLTGQIVP
jgi:hypothetical protein